VYSYNGSSGAPGVFNYTTRGAGGSTPPITYSGLPQPVLELSVASGAAVRLLDGSYVSLVIVWYQGATDTTSTVAGANIAERGEQVEPRLGGLPGPCCKDTVVAFTSRDGYAWVYAATVCYRSTHG